MIGRTVIGLRSQRFRRLRDLDLHLLSPKGGRTSKSRTHAKWVFAVLFRVLSKLARPKRFELLTPRFVVWCSIQLSYGRASAPRARLQPAVGNGGRRLTAFAGAGKRQFAPTSSRAATGGARGLSGAGARSSWTAYVGDGRRAWSGPFEGRQTGRWEPRKKLLTLTGALNMFRALSAGRRASLYRTPRPVPNGSKH